MHKANVVLAIALVLAVLAGVALNQVNEASAQGDLPVGVVVAYTPGVSITIIDQKGNQIEFALDSAVKVEPPDGEKSLKLGAFVTIIAPASLSKEKQIAVGIVVHPEKELAPSQTPLVKNTPVPTDPPATVTPKVSDTPTPPEINTPTPVETLTGTPAPSTTLKEDGKTLKTNTFIEWLRSLFLQVLSRG